MKRRQSKNTRQKKEEDYQATQAQIYRSKNKTHKIVMNKGPLEGRYKDIKMLLLLLPLLCFKYFFFW